MSRVVLISTYELGRQPFGLASPAAWLRDAGATVTMQDLAVQELDRDEIRTARLVAIHVPMHTATRMAEPVLSRVRELAPEAHVCVYGLYAPMNAEHLRALGADSIIGGEFEKPLLDLYLGLDHDSRPTLMISLSRQQFLVPDRVGLPTLDHYATLRTGTGETRRVGYTEATRGCKHLCRHCPIVPVYGGKFRVVDPDVVVEDVSRQVAAGAEHITFGDPDFFNAPAHARRILSRLHQMFPALSYDVTIKVEHLLAHSALLPTLRDTGCILVTSAVESLDDDVLRHLDKRHTVADLERALEALRAAGLALNPTFVAFTPWTTLLGYAHFLRRTASLALVDLVSPVQYGIRLLIPAGSRVLELADVRELVEPFDPHALAFPWANPDSRVDDLQRDVMEVVRGAQDAEADRRAVFHAVWDATMCHLRTEDADPPDLGPAPTTADAPRLSEPWYCCAEPTEAQLVHL